MEYYTGRRINVRAIIYKDGKLLAVKHKHGDNISHYYAVPGGGLDPHESLVDGLARELREETGIDAVIGNLLFIQQLTTVQHLLLIICMKYIKTSKALFPPAF